MSPGLNAPRRTRASVFSAAHGSSPDQKRLKLLAVHVRCAPGVVEAPGGDRIEVRQFMNFSISVDHRLADGADGARMLTYLRTLLENPGLLAL